MPLTLRSAYQADLKRIDKQTKRETSGLGRIDPKWAQNKSKIPTTDTILRDVPTQFTGGYGPHAKAHPTLRVSRFRGTIKMTEGDIPFDAREDRHPLRDAKDDNKLFSGWGKNPLAGLPATLDEAKGKPPRTAKHPSPLGRKSFALGNGRPIVPPLARYSVGGFEQMVQGWVR
jgi:hypothetical protein